MLVWHCYPTATSELTASEHSASCKNLDLADRSCSTDRFQIVLNDLDVALFTRSAAKLLTRDEARRIAVNTQSCRSLEISKDQEIVMTRVLLVGYDPETVDYSNPALPPGMSAQKIRAGIALTLKQMTDRGWESDLCFIRPDETAGQTVERHLASANYACVVIGAGVRLPPQGLEVFEAVVNAVHRGAPGAAIAFNTRPEDSAEAAARWLPLG
jgi:hypothetical protein